MIDGRLRRFVTGALAAAGFSASAFSATAPVRETARASLVEVPVNVTGSDGRPVTGLTAADFQIECDGKRQPILSLDVIDLRRPGRDASPPSVPAVARRHFLFLFDFSFAGAHQIARSRDAARRFVSTGLQPGDLAAVATTSAETGLRLLVTFTADRRQILGALQAVGLPTEIDRSRDPLAFAFAEPGDPRLVIQEGFASTAAVDAASTQKIYAGIARRVADDYSVTRIERHLTDMSTLATALDLVQGRKIVLYFSEGFDGRLLVGSIARQASVEQTLADNDAMMSGAAWSIDVDRRYASGPVQRQLDGAVDLLRRSDCVVYAIDVAGLAEARDGTIGSPGRGADSLFAFAHGTGGELIAGGNDFTDSLARVAQRLSFTYVLTFRAPPESHAADGYHSLRVRTRAHGARVSARAGYFDHHDFGRQGPLARVLAATDVITHEKDRTGFPLDVLAFPVFDRGIRRVPILLRIPPEAVPQPPESGTVSLEVYVYAADSDGTVVDYFTRRIAIEAGEQRTRFSRNGLVYYGLCRLLPGRYHLRIYVRNSVDGRFGFRVVPLELPETEHAPEALLPPLFLSDPPDAIAVKDPLTAESPAADPFQLGGTAFFPQLTPTIAAGADARVCLMLYRSSRDAADRYRVDLEILDAQGGHHHPDKVEILGRTEPDREGLVKLLLRFSAPSLESAEYVLRAALPGGKPGAGPAETRFRIP